MLAGQGALRTNHPAPQGRAIGSDQHSNIAEGAAKRGPREFRRFLDTALGSLSEVSYLLRFSRDYGILSKGEWSAVEGLRSEVGRLTWRLYSVISQQARDQPPS